MAKVNRRLPLSSFLCMSSCIRYSDGFGGINSFHHNNQQRKRQLTQFRLSQYCRQGKVLLTIPVKSNSVYINGNTNSSTSIEDERLPTIPFVLSELNVLYGIRTSVEYDPRKDQFISKKGSLNRISRNETSTIVGKSLISWNNPIHDIIFHRILPRLRVSFLPSGVTSNYYSFMKWRIVQRFVNANLHVFGTQSLLLGLGIKANMNSRLGALSAALNWVLKDALGKIVRMIWASKMGLRFDGDAKRWRFRSAFVFAAGNGMEIATYIFPGMFLLWATLANCCKQISTLTSSSTRSSIFNSFRDGTRENIADITAKGEAQIAIVELVGISSGIALSRLVGMSVKSILSVYVTLQALEIFCVYSQLRHVEYRVLNFERLVHIVNEFIRNNTSQKLVSTTTKSIDDTIANSGYTVSTIPSQQQQECSNIPSPHDVARDEKMFLPPAHLSRRRVLFGSLGRSKLSPDEIMRLLHIFQNERFLLVVGTNTKSPPSKIHRLVQRSRKHSRIIQENCHIVLHAEATNDDVVKSTMALLLLRQMLSTLVTECPNMDVDNVRSYDCFGLIKESLEQTNQLYTTFLDTMIKQGWESPTKLMFARVNMRAEWPLVPLNG